MNDTVFLDEMASALAARGMPLAPESAMFVVLEALEALGGRAMVLSPSAICVAPDGAVSLGGAIDMAHDETSVLEGVVETLEAVLDPAPVSVTELAVKVRTAQVITRGAMLSELAALLVPLNRRAARRMLGRLARESRRPLDAPSALSTHAPIADDAPRDEVPASLLAGAARDEGPSDTVVDGATLEGRAPRLPEGWDDDDRLAKRRSAERRNAWLAVAVAAVALVAAVVFLVGRVKAAGA